MVPSFLPSILDSGMGVCFQTVAFYSGTGHLGTMVSFNLAYVTTNVGTIAFQIMDLDQYLRIFLHLEDLNPSLCLHFLALVGINDLLGLRMGIVRGNPFPFVIQMASWIVIYAEFVRICFFVL